MSGAHVSKLAILYAHELIPMIFIIGLLHGIRIIATTEKLAGLYRGIGPTLTAIAPFMAVQQVMYDILKQRSIQSSITPSTTLFLVCGSVAGATAQTVKCLDNHDDNIDIAIRLRAGCLSF